MNDLDRVAIRNVLSRARDLDITFRLVSGKLIVGGPENGEVEEELRTFKDQIFHFLRTPRPAVEELSLRLRDGQLYLVEQWKVLRHGPGTSRMVSEFLDSLNRWDILHGFLFGLPEHDGSCPIPDGGCDPISPAICLACSEERDALD